MVCVCTGRSEEDITSLSWSTPGGSAQPDSNNKETLDKPKMRSVLFFKRGGGRDDGTLQKCHKRQRLRKQQSR